MSSRPLVLICGLLLVLLLGRALSTGSLRAGSDARRTLLEQQGSSGALGKARLIGPPGTLDQAHAVDGPAALRAPAPVLPGFDVGPPPDHLPGTEPMSVPDKAGPFGCFHACGASCACAGRQDSTRTVEHGGKSCSYQVIQCNTHPFCSWHDQCYLDCDNSMPNALRSSGCYRQCDSSCLTGSAPWSDYPDPPGSYSLGDCVRWARHRDSAPSTGTLTYSQLQGCL